MSDTDWSKMFPALSICRQDLVNAGCSREQIAALTDEQMQQIAAAIDSYIEDYAFEEGEWDETVRFIVRKIETLSDRRLRSGGKMPKLQLIRMSLKLLLSISKHKWITCSIWQDTQLQTTPFPNLAR